jgi:zinc protease
VKRANRFVTDDGLAVVLEEGHAIPIVDVEICFYDGAVADPIGKEGLTRLLWRTARTGTKSLDSRTIEETIAKLGGRFSIEVSLSAVRARGVVIRRNLAPFVELVSDIVRKPAFRPADLAQAKRETYADFVAIRDSDRTLAAIHFRKMLFGDHPYGRSIAGNRKTVRAISRDELRESHAGILSAKNMLIGFAGDVDKDEVRKLVDRHFSGLSRKSVAPTKVPVPRARPKRRIRIVDKPDRTQVQTLVGALGSKVHDPLFDALAVANAGFGATLTSPLWREVREKRGWSYGASSRLGADRERDTWTMHTFPTAEHAVECLELELELLEKFVDDGITKDEHRLAKRYLVNSHCFDVDTASKRLEAKLDCDLYGLPYERLREYERRVTAVTHDASKHAVKKRLSKKDVSITLVAPAKTIADRVAKLPGIADVEVVRYDRDG